MEIKVWELKEKLKYNFSGLKECIGRFWWKTFLISFESMISYNHAHVRGKV